MVTTMVMALSLVILVVAVVVYAVAFAHGYSTHTDHVRTWTKSNEGWDTHKVFPTNPRVVKVDEDVHVVKMPATVYEKSIPPSHGTPDNYKADKNVGDVYTSAGGDVTK